MTASRCLCQFHRDVHFTNLTRDCYQTLGVHGYNAVDANTSQTGHYYHPFYSRILSMDANREQLDARFPKPVLLPSSIVPNPARQAGWTYGSTQAVLECLKDNHHRFHIFFGDMGFHK